MESTLNALRDMLRALVETPSEATFHRLSQFQNTSRDLLLALNARDGINARIEALLAIIEARCPLDPADGLHPVSLSRSEISELRALVGAVKTE